MVFLRFPFLSAFKTIKVDADQLEALKVRYIDQSIARRLELTSAPQKSTEFERDRSKFESVFVGRLGTVPSRRRFCELH